MKDDKEKVENVDKKKDDKKVQNTTKKSSNNAKSNNNQKKKNNNQSTKKENKKVEEVKKEEVKEVKAKKDVVKENKESQEVKEIKKAEAEAKKLAKEQEKKMNKAFVGTDKIAIFSVIAVVLLIAFGLFFYLYYSQNMVAVVTFDGGKVTRAEYEVYYKTFEPFLTTYYGYPEDQVGEQIAQKAALDKIIVKDATAAGVTLTDENKTAIDEVFNDEDRIKSFQQQGIDIDIMRQLYESDYIITNYMKKMAEDLTDDEVKAYITETYGDSADLYEYNTSHILFKTIDDSSSEISDEEKAAKKAKAEEILSRALAGEDFATLAKENSEDSTASDGGVFVMYMDGNTVTEYSDAVAKLNEGEVCATLVESDYGYHIIKLNKKVENGRLQNSNEREACVSEKINKLSEERNINVNTDIMNKIIEKLKSESTSTTTDNSSDSTEDTTTTTTEDTTTTDDTTVTEETTAE